MARKKIFIRIRTYQGEFNKGDVIKKFIYCEICGKSTGSGNNRPKSLHKTKRQIHPNIQKWNGLQICTRCRKTLNRELSHSKKSITHNKIAKEAKV